MTVILITTSMMLRKYKIRTNTLIFYAVQLKKMYITYLYIQKINYKNAFDIKMPNIKNMKDFSSIDEEGGWKNISSAFEIGVKIYGHKIDKVYNETYTLRGGITRADNEEEKNK